jgi:hypothetical protein
MHSLYGENSLKAHFKMMCKEIHVDSSQEQTFIWISGILNVLSLFSAQVVKVKLAGGAKPTELTTQSCL